MVNPKSIYPLIGKEISRLRKNKKWTQEELAKAVSLTRTSITNIEKGRQKILIHTLWDLAEQLDVHPSKLLPKKVVPPVSSTHLIEKVDKAKEISTDDKNKLKELILKQGDKDQ